MTSASAETVTILQNCMRGLWMCLHDWNSSISRQAARPYSPGDVPHWIWYGVKTPLIKYPPKMLRPWPMKREGGGKSTSERPRVAAERHHQEWAV